MEIDLKKINLHFQRFEFKYQMPKALVEGVIPALLKHMVWDPYVRDKEQKYYHVNSLYYDNAGFACYWEKEAGLKRRKKLRLRFYDDILKPESKVFAEIKRKTDAVVIKDRAAMTYLDCQKLFLNNDFEVLKNLDKTSKDLLEEFLWLKYYNCLMPQYMVSYKRTPLISKFDSDIRVTLDSEIKAYKASWLDKKLGFITDVYPQTTIMEIKYNNVLPQWLHQIIQQCQLEREPFSKYCNSVLAANRY